MSKKLKYMSVKQDETIDISLAFSQAAALLDKVAKKAIDENDEQLLLDVADRWITIGKLFASAELGTEHMDTNSETQYGFCKDQNEEGVESEDD